MKKRYFLEKATCMLTKNTKNIPEMGYVNKRYS